MIQERLDIDAGSDPAEFRSWLLGKLDEYWAEPDTPELLTNTIAYVFHRDRGEITIEDDLCVFDSHEVPFAAFRDYLLARYP